MSFDYTTKSVFVVDYQSLDLFSSNKQIEHAYPIKIETKETEENISNTYKKERMKIKKKQNKKK